MRACFRLGDQGLTNLLRKPGAAAAVEKAVPQFFEGVAHSAPATEAAAPSMFAAFEPRAGNFDANATIRGAQAPALPAMRRMPLQ